MLRDGFEWPRWRDPVDGFEPYEDKLREWNALGDAERSEQFLFAAVHEIPNRGTLGQSLAKDGARHAGNLSSPHRSTTGYGPVTLTFDPRTLANATVLSGVTVPGLFGTGAGTIEHLPGLMASRIVSYSLARWDAYHSYLLATGRANPSVIAEHHEAARRVTLALDDAVSRSDAYDRRDAVSWLYDQLHARWNPIEAHVRGLTPDDVIHVDIEPPTVESLPRVPTPYNGPRNVRYPVTERGRKILVDKLVHPDSRRDIEDAARARRIPLGGFAYHRRVSDMADDALAAHPRSIEVREYPNEPPISTAQETADHRRRMRAARDAATVQATAP